ncbi:MAG TPA: hypothetical protein VKR22_10095 [Acidimicrobiales bacterium]|nr:hypothetical protein [Acidimicrobiales bacterium]
MGRPEPCEDEEPVSLHPLSFEEALAGLLAVDPADVEDSEEEPEQPE